MGTTGYTCVVLSLVPAQSLGLVVTLHMSAADGSVRAPVEAKQAHVLRMPD